MAELFDCIADGISLYSRWYFIVFKNINKGEELDAGTTTESFSVVQNEGGRNFYVMEKRQMNGRRIQQYWSHEMEAMIETYRQIEILIPAKGRKGSAHCGEDGRYVETLIREYLKRYLPKDLEVLTGILSVYYDKSRNNISRPGFTAFPSKRACNRKLGNIVVMDLR